MHVPVIRTERLDLVSMSPDFIQAVLAGEWTAAESMADFVFPTGWPDDRDRSLLRRRCEQIMQDRDSQEWLLRAIILRRPRRMIGHIGFHGPPGVVGRAELGYSIIPECRRQGYASEAALAMTNWAQSNHGVTNFFVAISSDNQPSLALAAKLGFVRVGEQIDDEDGLEYVFELVRS